MTRSEIAKLWCDATDELSGVQSLEAAESFRVKWIGTQGIIRQCAVTQRDAESFGYARDVYHATLRAWNDKMEMLRGVPVNAVADSHV